MSDQPQLSSISCKRCKYRKVRCDRRLPRCDKCEEQGVDCHYAQRVPRRPMTVTTTDRVTFLETKLSEVLLRLDRIEGRWCNPHTHEPPPNLGPNPHDLDEYTLHNSPTLEPLPTQANPNTPLFILEHAVIQMQKRIASRLRNVDSTTSSLQLEPDVAKSWIKAYFANLPEDIFPTLLNVKLIEMMPDIIGLPNVHLDASIVVIYYCILYHGLSLQQHELPTEERASTMDQLYDQCLKAAASWKSSATGTLADLNAAFFMVRISAECFDVNLSWTMFQFASRCAEKTGLYCVDQNTSLNPSESGYSTLDASRKCFWELICMDLYFHMFHNKPLLMQMHWNCAKVNLPWLAEAESQQTADSVTTIRFLLDSRRTFILMKFWTLLQDAKSRPDSELLPKTEALCAEIESLYEQWPIDALAKNMMYSGGQLWTIAGLALEGRACILSMLQHVVNTMGTQKDEARMDVGAPEPVIATSPHALSASRRMVEALGSLLSAMPSLVTVAVTFTVLRVHVACACLKANIERTALSTDEHKNDIALLQRVSRYLSLVAAEHNEIEPLSALLNV